MNKKFTVILIVLILSFTAINFSPISAQDNSQGDYPGTIIYVDYSGNGNFTSIQDAIDYASEGDTIFVRNGTYYENLIINKSINLIGENKHSTIIDGEFIGDIIKITADNVTVSKFKIKNVGLDIYDINNPYAAVKILSNNNNISGNIIQNPEVFETYDYATVGIFLKNSSYSIIKDNTIKFLLISVYLLKSLNNNIFQNQMSRNICAIYQVLSHKNIINKNNMDSNDYCILFIDSANNTVYHNNFLNSSIYVDQIRNEYDIDLINQWDNGYPSGGNFWDIYEGKDENNGPNQDIPGSDGICDSPFEYFDENSHPIVDNYPLISNYPFGANFVYEILDNFQVYFDCATYIYDGANIVNYTWDLDDGSQKFEKSFTHQYPNQRRIYNVTLTITDSFGRTDSIIKSFILSYKTIYVDDEYNENTPGWQQDHFNCIQDAIDVVCSNGDIYVFNGIYEENIQIRTKLNLIGQDRDNTIIDGKKIKDTITILADEVSITNFTIQNGSYESIEINSMRNIISYNNIKNSKYGIIIDYNSDSFIYGNNFMNNSRENIIDHSNRQINYDKLGNFWNDYNGIDENKDGIGDTPYYFKYANQDNYPLINKYPFGASFHYDINNFYVEFTSTSFSYLGNEIIEFIWHFGDGQTAQGEIVSHQYPVKKGYYDVSLTVTDDQGRVETTTETIYLSYKEVFVDDDFDENTIGWQETHYDKIQDAIDAVLIGGNIYVNDGSYFESLSIEKSINLIGQSDKNTYISPNNNNKAISVHAKNVNVSGFSFDNGRYYTQYYSENSNCENLIIENCTFLNNEDPALILYYCTNFKVLNCNFYDNDDSIHVQHSQSGLIKNCLIENDISNAIQIRHSSQDIKVSNCEIYNNTHGIKICYYSHDNIVENCSINNNQRGIYFYKQNKNNLIKNNEIKNNTYGIMFRSYSNKYNIITENNIIENQQSINITGGTAGKENSIFLNNFIDNEIEAFDAGENNWNDTNDGQGNYWHNYNGQDNNDDGIGDTPYNITGGNNKDLYPFVNPIQLPDINSRPEKPDTPIGPNAVYINTEYVFTFSATDQDQDNIWYYINWGDGKIDEGLGPYESGEEIQVSHSWSNIGNYEIITKVKDINGSFSKWSEPLIISVDIPPAEHDIALEYIQCNHKAYKNKEISFNVKVKNIGINTENDIEIQFFLNHNLFNTNIIEQLAPQESRNINIKYTPSENGLLNFSVKAIPQEGEDRLSDNDLFKIIKVYSVQDTIITTFDSPYYGPFGLTIKKDPLTYKNKTLYHSDSNSDKIYILNPENGYITNSFDSPGPEPRGLAWDGEHLWNADEETDKIYKLNPINGTILQSFDAPDDSPYAAIQGITWESNALWVLDWNFNKIYKLDPSNGAVLKTLSTPTNQCTGLTWDGQYLWCADINPGSHARLLKLDSSDGSIIDFIDSPEAWPSDLAWDGEYLWNTDSVIDDIYKIDVNIRNNEWEIMTIDPYCQAESSLTIDKNNKLHMCYYDGLNSQRNLKYSFWDGSSWITQTINNEEKVGFLNSIITDSNAYPHISYLNGSDWENKRLEYARFIGFEWEFQTVDDKVAGRDTSIDVDSNDYPHIAYVKDDTDNVTYAYWNGTDWIYTNIIHIGDFGDVTLDLSLKLDSNDNPHIIFYKKNVGDLYYAFFDGSSWTIEWVDDNGMDNSLDIDSNDNPHISYWDHSKNHLKYAKRIDSDWIIDTIDDSGNASRSSIKLDSNDLPHISYRDVRNRDIKYATWVGFWDIQTIEYSGNVGMVNCIDLDSNNIAYISYRDNSNNHLQCAKHIITGANPSLSCDLSSHDFGNVEIGNRVQKMFTIWNSGTGTLSYTISEDCPWLTLTRYEGYSEGEAENIWLKVNTNNLEPGDYSCQIQISSNGGFKTIDVFVTAVDDNSAPNQPDKPTGPVSGLTNNEYSYIFNTTDPDEDQVLYYIDWGDGNSSGWTEPSNSGQEITLIKSWSQPGEYDIKVRAKDPYNQVSLWSESLTVSINQPTNVPPDIPEIPSGPNQGYQNYFYDFTTRTIDPEDHQVKYGWDWNGDGIVDEWSGLNPDDTIITTSHSWQNIGTYNIQVKAEDELGAQSEFSQALMVTIQEDTINDPPIKPQIPEGPDSGIVLTDYEYSFITTDPEGDNVSYFVDWGDGNTSDWSEEKFSGEEFNLTHNWSSPGNYKIKVKAKDTEGLESSYSDNLTVEINEESIPEAKLKINIDKIFYRGKVSAYVKNIGSLAATNINLSIDLEYGILNKQTSNSTIYNNLEPNCATESLELKELRGIGSLTMKIKATADNAETVETTVTGFILGKLIIILS